MGNFDLAMAIEVLRSTYHATYVQPYTSQNGLEAEVGLGLDDKMLHVEFSVELNERRVTVTSVYTTEVPTGTIQPLQELPPQQNETSTYAHDPRVVEYIARIKRDIGISDFAVLSYPCKFW